MARKKKRRAFNQENLPVFVPETSSLPLWCSLILATLLCFLVQISLLRSELHASKEKLKSFEALLKRSADFLNTTSNNSNWPSSVTASPIMERGRSLLDEIRAALGLAVMSRPAPDVKAVSLRIGCTHVCGIFVGEFPLCHDENPRYASLSGNRHYFRMPLTAPGFNVDGPTVASSTLRHLLRKDLKMCV